MFSWRCAKLPFFLGVIKTRFYYRLVVFCSFVYASKLSIFSIVYRSPSLALNRILAFIYLVSGGEGEII